MWKTSIGDCPCWWGPRPYCYGIKHLSKKPWFYYCTSNCAHDVSTNHSKCESFLTFGPNHFIENRFCTVPSLRQLANCAKHGSDKTKGSSWWVSPHARVRDWPLAPEVEILLLLVRSTWAKQLLFQQTAHSPGGIGWIRLWVMGQRTTNVQSAGTSWARKSFIKRTLHSQLTEHGCPPKKGLVVMNHHSSCNSKTAIGPIEHFHTLYQRKPVGGKTACRNHTGDPVSTMSFPSILNFGQIYVTSFKKRRWCVTWKTTVQGTEQILLKHHWKRVVMMSQSKCKSERLELALVFNSSPPRKNGYRLIWRPILAGSLSHKIHQEHACSSYSWRLENDTWDCTRSVCIKMEANPCGTKKSMNLSRWIARHDHGPLSRTLKI